MNKDYIEQMKLIKTNFCGTICCEFIIIFIIYTGCYFTEEANYPSSVLTFITICYKRIFLIRLTDIHSSNFCDIDKARILISDAFHFPKI